MAQLNRRGFLGAIAGGLVLDPERLLWRPKRYVCGVDRGRSVVVVHEFWARDERGFWVRTIWDDAGQRIIGRGTWPHSEPPFAGPYLFDGFVWRGAPDDAGDV